MLMQVPSNVRESTPGALTVTLAGGRNEKMNSFVPCVAIDSPDPISSGTGGVCPICKVLSDAPIPPRTVMIMSGCISKAQAITAGSSPAE